MKIKLTLATATAIGLMMGTAWAGDNNKSFSVQDGNSNALSVDQDGNNNVAGIRTNFSEYLKQDGDDNLMVIKQTGDNNKVARNGPSVSGAFQTGNLNKLTLSQTSFDYGHYTNGHVIDRIRQNSSDTATGNTNDATITQRGTDATITGQGPSAGHYIGIIQQTHTLGDANSLTIDQAGAFSAWYGGNGQNNRIGTVTQNGSGNTATLNQDGTGPVLTTSGQQQRGPSNVIQSVDQQGSGHEAKVTQNGFQNYVGQVKQSDLDNSAIISLTGDGNGATRQTGHPIAGVLVRGAGAAGALASSVVQGGGSNNQVNYTVLNGNDNQFGFKQNGNGNQALGILITGDRNQLGVNQNGDNNQLSLSTIDGNDNIIGLKQDGSSNVASLNVAGDRNVGFNDFTGGPAGALATSALLTPGLLEQSGTFNQVTLTVDNGFDNVFASLQDNSASPSAGAWNVIVATQTGSDNQAAVVQVGNNNTANLSQTGGMNDASISQ